MIIEVNEITALFDEFYLIEEKPLIPVKESEIPLQINFEGGNGKGLVFMFGHPTTPEDNEMISKLIHNALKIKMEDVALIQLSTQKSIQLEQVIEIMKPKHLILWGNHAMFPSGSPMYTVGKIAQIPFVNVDEVNRFHLDVTLKTSLWNSILQLLNG
jgi:hypothetical protein